MTLRPYQQYAHDMTIEYIKKSAIPCILELATGAGKSIIVASLAHTIHRISGGKHILCLAPSAELVTQNREKYLKTGNPASIFSASAGGKCLRHPVVFGTPGTVKNSIHKFGDRFAAIIIDEAHGITPTVKTIIEEIQKKNDKVRVIGLSATPYRLGDGYIYREDENGKIISDDQTRNPFFHKLLCRVTAPYLIEQGYLSRPVIGEIGGDHYDTSSMKLNSRGQFNQADIDRAYHGHGRKTASIIADVIAKSRDRKGVMLFSATVQHANEVMASLPPELSAIITGDTPKAERDSIIKKFKAKQIKYLVNVAVLTVGFDSPNVDVIALLRATESPGLLQQIIGRGLRLDDGKENCLILDYAENTIRHFPDGDLFNPTIYAKGAKEGSSIIDVKCPDCGCTNQFTARINPEQFGIDSEGYFIDLAGMRIKTDAGFIPAHYGRRCNGVVPTTSAPYYLRCGHRWDSKECPHCNSDNDIAARYCSSCKKEIIDPNEKLRLDFKALKKDPYQTQIDEVLDYQAIPTTSQAGNPCWRVEFKTPYRNFTIWIQSEPKSQRAASETALFLAHKNSIRTVTYKKESNGFYRVTNYNQPIQEIPA